MDRGKAYGVVFNPILLAKSREVVKIIENIAHKHRFGCNDLILAVLWQCLSATTNRPEPQVRGPNTIHLSKDYVVDSKPAPDSRQPKYSSSTQQMSHTAAESNKLTNKYTTTHGQSMPKYANKSSNIIASRPESSNEKNKLRNKKQTNLENLKVPDENVEVINIDDDEDDIIEDKILSTEVNEVKESTGSEVHEVEISTSSEVHEVEISAGSEVHEVEISTGSEVHKVEISSEVHEEETNHVTKTVLAENVECSYFEMDCDEIDENDDHNDDDDVVATVIETKSSDPVSIVDDKVIDADTSEKTNVQTLDSIGLQPAMVTLDNVGLQPTTLDSSDLQPSTFDSIGLQPKSSTTFSPSVKTNTDSIGITASNETSSHVTVSTSKPESTSSISKLSDADLPTCISPSELTESTWTDTDGPPRKKRLLDHDKKWHMAPKHNVEQDKYLALPGGIDQSDEDETTKDSTSARRSSTSARRSHSPPSVGIEVDNVEFDNYKKDFRQSPANVDTKSDNNSEDDAGVKADKNDKSEVSEDLEMKSDKKKSSKLVAARSKFSKLKKPSGLRSSSQGTASQFLQIAKIGRKGFGRKTDESGDSVSHVNMHSRKTNTRMSSRQSKFRVGRSRKYFTSDATRKSAKASLRVQTDIPGTSGSQSKQRKDNTNNSKRYKRKCGRPRKFDTSDSGQNKSPNKNVKSKSKRSGSDGDSSAEEIIGFVEESEWTTEVNGKESGKRSRTGSGNRSSRRTSKGAGKSSKQKSTDPHVEVLVMDVDDIKFFDDIPNVIGSNELGETSADQGGQANDEENSDSDVIILD